MLRSDERILAVISEDPCLTQQEVAERAGVTRETCRRAEDRLRKAGLLLGTGYVLPSSNTRQPLVTVALIRSPKTGKGVQEIEEIIRDYWELGSAYMITGRAGDYVLLSHCSVNDQRFAQFIEKVRYTVGPGTECCVVVRQIK